MMKRVFIALLLLASSATLQAQITIPNTLTAGQVIRASELNTNFSALGEKALNRITGGAIEGNITLTSNITIDGVDISDFLLSTGEVLSQTLGTVTAPAHSFSTDANTGLYSPGADQVALTLGGTQRLLLNSSGLTVFGVNIINSSGLIPAISSTYFASLSGANLTSLNASNISSGTLADGRLSSNVPLLDAATNTFTGNLVAVNGTLSGTLGVTGTSTLGAVNAAATAVTTLRVGTTATAGNVLTADTSGNATWQAPGVASGAVPTGMIALFDTSCPATWTRFSALDDKFPRGGPTYAAGGGSDTHAHSVDPASVTSGSDGAHAHTIDPINYTVTAGGAHTHSFSSGATTSTDGSHTHTGTTDSGGSHTHTLSSAGGLQSGSDVTGAQNSPTDSSGSHTHTFTTGSGGSHSHTVSLPSTASSSTHTHDLDILPFDSGGVGPHTHTVDVASTNSSTTSNVPAYVQMVFCKKD